MSSDCTVHRTGVKHKWLTSTEPSGEQMGFPALLKDVSGIFGSCHKKIF